MVPDLFLIDTDMKDRWTATSFADGSSRIRPGRTFRSSSSPTAGRRRTSTRAMLAGGVDYIVKPCHLSEFLSRVRTQIKLYQLVRQNDEMQATAIDANPLTHLPGNNTIHESHPGGHRRATGTWASSTPTWTTSRPSTTPTGSSSGTTCSSSTRRPCTRPCARSATGRDSWGTSAATISW